MEKDLSYFTIEAPTPREALERMRRQYGAEAKILTHKTVRRGGLAGLFTREAVEITGYVPQAQAQAKGRKEDLEEVKKKILADARREQSLQLILKEIQALKQDLEAVKKKILADARREQPLQLILKVIQALKQ
jgi:flagellar biosynthesis protein FlhF